MTLLHRTRPGRSLLSAVALMITGCATPFTSTDSSMLIPLTAEQLRQLTSLSTTEECRLSERPVSAERSVDPFAGQDMSVPQEPVWDVEEVQRECGADRNTVTQAAVNGCSASPESDSLRTDRGRVGSFRQPAAVVTTAGDRSSPDRTVRPSG